MISSHRSLLLLTLVSATLAGSGCSVGNSNMRAALPALAPHPRDGHVMVTAGAGGGILLFGGGTTGLGTPRAAADSLWSWNGVAWRVASATSPGARTLPAAAFDGRRNVLVVYGGAEYGSGTRFGDTWEWDGRDWSRREVRGPGPRDHHAMAYDEARGYVVMYGGFDYNRSREPRDTWTWNGAVWTRADTAGPGGMAHHAMAYDARRQRVVLFGFVRRPVPGQPQGPGALGVRSETPETWEWNGSQWDRVFAEGEPAIADPHRMTYDAARGVIVMTGGRRDSTRATWTYDGSRWTPQGSIGVGVAPALAYDARRQRVIAWGGSAAFIPGRSWDAQTPPARWPGAVWEWDGQAWKAIGGSP
jgi:hypothetical protein